MPPIESTTTWRCACCDATVPVTRNESPPGWVYAIQFCEICDFPGEEVYCPACVAAYKAAFVAVREQRRPKSEGGG